MHNAQTTPLIWVFFSLFMCMTCAMLPPGNEEVVLCPPQHCLHRRPHHSGWSGPKTKYYMCCNSGKTCDPKTWGKNADVHTLLHLLDEKWQTDKCDSDVQCKHQDEKRPQKEPSTLAMYSGAIPIATLAYASSGLYLSRISS